MSDFAVCKKIVNQNPLRSCTAIEFDFLRKNDQFSLSRLAGYLTIGHSYGSTEGEYHHPRYRPGPAIVHWLHFEVFIRQRIKRCHESWEPLVSKWREERPRIPQSRVLHRGHV